MCNTGGLSIDFCFYLPKVFPLAENSSGQRVHDEWMTVEVKEHLLTERVNWFLERACAVTSAQDWRWLVGTMSDDPVADVLAISPPGRNLRPMGARQKLNQIYLTGTLAVAAVVGLLTQSAFMFCLALGLLAVTHLHGGSIRLRKPRR